MTDKEIEIKEKKYILAEREYKSMGSLEIINLLLTTVYNKMSDETVLKLWEDTRPCIDD